MGGTANGNTGTGGYFTTNSVTPQAGAGWNGSGVAGFDTGAANTGYGGYFANTGAGNTVNYGGYFNTSTTGAGYALFATITSSTGYAGYFSNESTATGHTSYGVYGLAASTSGYGVFCGGSGLCGGHTTWTSTSDGRQKTDVTDLATADGLETVTKLRPVTFRWKDKHADQGRHLGFIAQEVEPLYPEVVSTNSDGMKSLGYSDLVVPLVKAVQELKADNDNLRSEVDALQAEVAALKKGER